MTLKRVIPTYMNMYMLLVPMYPIRLRNNIIFGLCYMIFSGIGSNFFLNGLQICLTSQVLKCKPAITCLDDLHSFIP